MSWFYRLSTSYENTNYWGRFFTQKNPEFTHRFDVYQSSDFPNVFLGGEDEIDDAIRKAGQPMCKIIDCRDLPEIDSRTPSWDYDFYLRVKSLFDRKVEDLSRIIMTTDCPIYIHCALGANRSVSVLAAAISLLTHRPIDAILEEMKRVRSFVNPQDPYYLMALEKSSADSPEFKERRFLELDQDFPLIQPQFEYMNNSVAI